VHGSHGMRIGRAEDSLPADGGRTAVRGLRPAQEAQGGGSQGGGGRGGRGVRPAWSVAAQVL